MLDLLLDAFLFFRRLFLRLNRALALIFQGLTAPLSVLSVIVFVCVVLACWAPVLLPLTILFTSVSFSFFIPLRLLRSSPVSPPSVLSPSPLPLLTIELVSFPFADIPAAEVPSLILGRCCMRECVEDSVRVGKGSQQMVAR